MQENRCEGAGGEWHFSIFFSAFFLVTYEEWSQAKNGKTGEVWGKGCGIK